MLDEVALLHQGDGGRRGKASTDQGFVILKIPGQGV